MPAMGGSCVLIRGSRTGRLFGIYNFQEVFP